MEEKIGGNEDYVFYRLLIVSIVVFLFLVFSLGVLLVLEQVPGFFGKESGLRGELSSLKWSGDGVTVVLGETSKGIKIAVSLLDKDLSELADLLSEFITLLIENGLPFKEELIRFNLIDGGKTLEIFFEGRLGDSLRQGTIMFLNQSAEYCEFDLTSDIEAKLAEGEIYELNATQSGKGCGIDDLGDFLTVIDLAPILEMSPQLRGFFDIDLMKNENRTDALDLDDYFNCNETFAVNIFSEGTKISVVKDEENWVSIYPEYNWVGTERIIIDVVCNDLEFSDDFYVNVLDTGNQTFGTSSGDNESINGTGVINGTGNESDGGGGDDGFDGRGPGSREGIKIESPRPEGNLVFVFLDTKRTFSIRNTEYDSIEWILDGKVVENMSNRFTFDGSSEGEYVLKVQIKEGSDSDSKIWDVVVRKRDKKSYIGIPQEGGLKKVLIYLIGIVLLLVVVFAISLFFIKRNKRRIEGTRRDLRHIQKTQSKMRKEFNKKLEDQKDSS